MKGEPWKPGSCTDWSEGRFDERECKRANKRWRRRVRNEKCMNDELTCDVCGKPALGVCNALGPVSCAFCRECLQHKRYPWWIVVGYAMSLERGEEAPWFAEVIKTNCEYYGKTVDEFWKEVREAYEDYCKSLEAE